MEKQTYISIIKKNRKPIIVLSASTGVIQEFEMRMFSL